MAPIMKLILTTCLLICSFGQVTRTHAAEEEWDLRRDRESIQVFSRAVEGSAYAQVKTTTVLENVSLASLVALIEDVEACPTWADKCAESYVFERVNETEAYVYTHNDMPFPIKDRDVLAHVQWVQDPGSLKVTMNSVAMSGMLAEVRGRLRLTQANASWTFLPLESGSVEISNTAHINPGSNLPGWVTNMLLVDTPFETMKAFVAEVAKPKYQNAAVGFIREP